MNKIVRFIKISDGSLIGYLSKYYDITLDINNSKVYEYSNDMSWLKITYNDFLNKVYRKDWRDVEYVSKHTYNSLYEKWFKDIERMDIKIEILDKTEELRKLKIYNIKKR